MQSFFQYHSKLDPFRLFSVEHLVTICIIVISCLLVFVFRKKINEKRKQRTFRLSLAFLLLITDALEHIWLLTENAWTIRKDLPLQLSDLAVLLAIVMLLTKRNKIFQFMYFAGLGSSIQAILTPDLGEFSFPHFQYIEFFVSHGGTVLACIFMVAAFSFRPTIRSMWVTIIIVNLYAAFVFFLNKLLHANYLYLLKKPGNASLLDYLGSWPWYLLSLELVMIVSFYILYSPFGVKKIMSPLRNR